jgi:hypothetical protein
MGEWVNLYLLRLPLHRSKILWSGLLSKEIGMWSGHMPFLNVFLYIFLFNFQWADGLPVSR